MAAVMDISEVRDLRRAIHANGYGIVAVRSAQKAPLEKGWEISARAKRLPFPNRIALNTGIICDELQAVDIDIDEPELAVEIAKLAKEMLGIAPERTRGSSGRVLFLYRALEGSPAKIKITKEKGAEVEVLGHGQQFVAFGIHPSGEEYGWVGPSPATVPKQDLPAVSQDEIIEFLTAAAQIIGADAPVDRIQPRVVTRPGAWASRDKSSELEELLTYVDASCSYDEWVQILMAIHHETGGSAEGFAIADQWSATGNNYEGANDIDPHWRSFGRISGGVTKSTIAEKARVGGADLSAIAKKYMEYEELTPEQMRDNQICIDNLWKAFEAKRRATIEAESIDRETGEVFEDEPTSLDPIGGAADYFDLPDSALHPGGIIEELADWICEWTRDPIRLHAIGAALVIVGTLIGRKVFSEDYPAGTSLYVAALARTGMGKDHPMSCIAMVLDAVAGEGTQHMTWNASLPSLANRLSHQASQVMIVDEFSDTLLAMRSRNASTTLSAISGGLRTLWGRANQGEWAPDLAMSRSATTIKWPNLSIYGATTVNDWKDALAGKDVTNGLFNRFLILPRYEEVEGQTRQKGQVKIPGQLLDRLRWLSECLPPLQMTMAARGDGHPAEPIMMPFSEGAEVMEKRHVQAQFELLRHESSERVVVLYARLAEMTKRVALIVAAGRRPEDVSQAVIDERDMSFAYNLVRWSLDQMVTMVRREMVENQFQAQHKMVVGIIRAANGEISKGEITRRLAGRIPRKPYEEILTMLSESGSVAVRELAAGKKGGRPSFVFRFVRD